MNIFKNYDGKNPNFGKLVDGVLELAPAALIIGNVQYIGNNSARYANAGYLPITYADKPEDTDEGHYEAIYTETDGKIVQSWEFVSDIPHGYIDTSKIKTFSYFCAWDRLNDAIDKISFSSNVTDFSYMFYNSENLKQVPLFDTSSGKNFSYMFYACNVLTAIPSYNTSNGTNFAYMFSGGVAIVEIGELDLTKATNIDGLFRNNRALKTIAGITFNSMPTSKMSSDIFYRCDNLENITIKGTIKVNSNDLKLNKSKTLTVESMVSVLNSLEDNTGEETRYTVYFGSTNLAKLTDEQRQIAENKNISLG